MTLRESIEKYLWGNNVFSGTVLPSLCFLAAAFLLGGTLAQTIKSNSMEQPIAADSGITHSEVNARNISNHIQLETKNWGLGFQKEGERPTGNATPEELAKYNAYYVAPGDEKIIYLTFDCGYENGNTMAILDALEKHEAKATFFVVGHYLESAPDQVKRMVEDGHTVGNHTYHHPDMSKISDAASFQKEMDEVRTLYQEIIGAEMPMYYRPPQGKYSIQNLQMAQNMGYSTFFWSLAYVDWNVDQQPGKEEAMAKLTKRIHPGAVVLLHNTSSTNAAILDDLLTEWEQMGYRFGTLEELCKEEPQNNVQR